VCYSAVRVSDIVSPRYAKFEPYSSDDDDMLQLMCQIAVFMSFFAGLLLKVAGGGWGGGRRGGVACSRVCMLACLYHHTAHTPRARALGRRERTTQ
jgi:hypothetical protein